MGIVLTHSAKYKPMSFERLIQPYVMATEEYRLLEKGIADLDTEAETMRQYADKEIANQLQANNIEVNEKNINKWIKDNPDSFASKYLNYADSLDAKATELATKGLKGVNRKSLYDLQTQYKTNVKPIEDAVETKKTKAAEQTKLVATNPNLRFDKDFSTLSLQELIDNPALGYTSYDLEDYEKRGSLVGSGILNRMSEKVTLDPTEQWFNVTKGVSQNDYSRWLFGDTDITHYEDPQSLKAFQEASRIANQEAMTVPAHLRNEVKTRVFDSIINSIKQTTDRRTNSAFETAAQKNARIRQQASLNAQMAKNNYKWNSKKGEWELTELGKQIELAELENTLNKSYKKIARDKDGNPEKNPDGSYKIANMNEEEIQLYKKSGKSGDPSNTELRRIERKKKLNLMYDANGDEANDSEYYTTSENALPIDYEKAPENIRKKAQEIAKEFSLDIGEIEIYASEQIDNRNWNRRKIYRFVGKGDRDSFGNLITSPPTSTTEEESKKKEEITEKTDSISTNNIRGNFNFLPTEYNN